MNWMIYAAAAALFLAAADCIVKLAAGKMPNSLALLLYGSVPFLTGIVWFSYDRIRNGPIKVQPTAAAYGIGVGVAFTIVLIAMYAMFRAGAPISLASPIVRLGGLIVASIAGVLLWNEAISGRYLVGMTLSIAGLYFLVKH